MLPFTSNMLSNKVLTCDYDKILNQFRGNRLRKIVNFMYLVIRYYSLKHLYCIEEIPERKYTFINMHMKNVREDKMTGVKSPCGSPT